MFKAFHPNVTGEGLVIAWGNFLINQSTYTCLHAWHHDCIVGLPGVRWSLEPRSSAIVQVSDMLLSDEDTDNFALDFLLLNISCHKTVRFDKTLYTSKKD